MNFLKIILPTLKNSPNIVFYNIRRVHRNLFVLFFILFIFSFLGVLILWGENDLLSKGFYFLGFVSFGYFTIDALRYLINPRSNKTYKFLILFGEPDEVAADISNEFKRRNIRIGRMFFTDQWLLDMSFFGFHISHLQNIVWAYGKITTQYTNFVKSGTLYNLSIYDKTLSNIIELNKCKKEELDAVLGHINLRLPWVVTGYSIERIALWSRDRLKFITLVEERKNAYKLSKIQDLNPDNRRF